MACSLICSMKQNRMGSKANNYISWIPRRKNDGGLIRYGKYHWRIQDFGSGGGGLGGLNFPAIAPEKPLALHFLQTL